MPSHHYTALTPPPLAPTAHPARHLHWIRSAVQVSCQAGGRCVLWISSNLFFRAKSAPASCISCLKTNLAVSSTEFCQTIFPVDQKSGNCANTLRVQTTSRSFRPSFWFSCPNILAPGRLPHPFFKLIKFHGSTLG